MKIKLLIVDDHPMMRESIMYKLKSKSKKYRFLIDKAESAEEAIEKVKATDYDFIIMDDHLPDRHGAEATALILKDKPTIKIMAFSNCDEDETIKSFLNAGAKGFVLKSSSVNEFIKATEEILTGKTYYSSEVTFRILTAKGGSIRINYQLHLLTKREIEVLRLIEHSSREIAKELNITKETVNGHKQKLLEKVNVKNSLGLMKFAIQAKLIDISVRHDVSLPPHLPHISTPRSSHILSE